MAAGTPEGEGIKGLRGVGFPSKLHRPLTEMTEDPLRWTWQPLTTHGPPEPPISLPQEDSTGRDPALHHPSQAAPSCQSGRCPVASLKHRAERSSGIRQSTQGA